MVSWRKEGQEQKFKSGGNKYKTDLEHVDVCWPWHAWVTTVSFPSEAWTSLPSATIIFCARCALVNFLGQQNRGHKDKDKDGAQMIVATQAPTARPAGWWHETEEPIPKAAPIQSTIITNSMGYRDGGSLVNHARVFQEYRWQTNEQQLLGQPSDGYCTTIPVILKILQDLIVFSNHDSQQNHASQGLADVGSSQICYFP